MPVTARHGTFSAGAIQGPTGIYGPGIGYDVLANMQVGGNASGFSNTYVSYRFKAGATSTLVSVRWYCIDRTHVGYGAGTGGTIRMTIEADSNGSPSGTPLATRDVVAPVDDFQLYTFASPPSLTSGQLYHLVFTNVDASPTTNYVSVDCLFNYNPSTPRQPRFTDSEWAALRKLGPAGAWTVQSGYTPILQIIYGDGTTQGMGYMEANVTSYGTITGMNSMVRELFTVSGGSRNVTGAGVRLIKASGSTDPLTVRLEAAGSAEAEGAARPPAIISSAVCGNNSMLSPDTNCRAAAACKAATARKAASGPALTSRKPPATGAMIPTIAVTACCTLTCRPSSPSLPTADMKA